MKKVVTIIACRNEEKNIEKVLTSLEDQSICPIQVAIVDDASSDNTYSVIEKFSKKNKNWLVYHREKNDERYASIVNTMKKASEMISEEFDFFMVLDADTVLEEKYIEKVLSKFESEPSLGIAGGQLTPLDGSESLKQKHDTEIVFGSNRIYSKKCWFEVNSGKTLNVNSVAWDTEHSIKARIRGFKTRRFDDIISKSIREPSLNAPFYLRGVLKYQFGFGFWNVLISGIINFKPDFILGYITACITKRPKIDDKENMSKIKKINSQEFVKKIEMVFKAK